MIAALDPTTPLKGLSVAVVDCEATHLPQRGGHVVEVAVVHLHLNTKDGATPRLAFRSRVRPPIAIPPEATAVHGIRDEDVADAPSFAAIVPSLRAALEGRVLVAFNAPADHDFLAVELARVGLPALPWPWLDLLVVRKATVSRGRPGRLAEIAASHGIALDAHGAAGDAMTTALLLAPLMRSAWEARAFALPDGVRGLELLRRESGPDEPEPPQRVRTLGEFFAWQREAALYQERDFAAYRRRQGDIGPPRCDWHVLEGVQPPSWEAEVRTAPCAQCGEPVRTVLSQEGHLVVVTALGEPHHCPTRAP